MSDEISSTPLSGGTAGADDGAARFADRLQAGGPARVCIKCASAERRRQRAEALARAAGRPLRGVGTADTWIGETEKNLDALLDQARGDGAVLFFDEADALFGRRTKVKDAHDRFANAAKAGVPVIFGTAATSPQADETELAEDLD
mgnify:CR=1 FL=1